MSGSTIVEKSAVEEVTEWKNHAKAAMAPAATRTMAHPGGRVRVRYEKPMPAVTSTMATMAVFCETSPRAAQAAMGTRTAPRQAARRRMECSGGPGLFARRIASSTLHQASAPAPRRRPAGAGHRPSQAPAGTPAIGHGGQHRARGLDGAEEDRVPPSPAGRTTVPRARSATRSASSGSVGQLHRHGDRPGRGPLELPHHQLAGVRGRPPVDEAPVVTRRVGAGTPGQAHCRSAAARATSPASSCGRGARPRRPPAAGRHVQLGGSASRTRRLHHCRANGAAEAMSSVTASCTPRRSGTTVMRSPTVAPSARPGRRRPRDPVARRDGCAGGCSP